METFGSLEKMYPHLPKQTVLQGDLTLWEYEGVWLYPPRIPSVQNVVRDFKPLHSDVILASFPKTGTTWLKSLLFSIVHHRSSSSSKLHSLTENHPHELVPSLEFQVYNDKEDPPKAASSSPPSYRRIFSTHIPHHILEETFDSSDCRVVYVAREPKDTIVSYWHFSRKMKKDRKGGALEEFVEMFCKGVFPFGPYYDHVLGYKKESWKRPNKVLFITYEELKNDTKKHVERLAEFLGCPIDKEEELEEIVKKCSIETLTSHQVNNSSEAPSWAPTPYSSFFRKGQVGDYQNYMSKEMIDLVDATTLEKFGGLSCDELVNAKDAAGGK